MTPPTALPADKLAHRCDAAQFPFATTAELVDLEQIVGQDRAAAAVEFGIGIERHGYNLFVMGPAGSGKHTLVKQYLAERVRETAKSSAFSSTSRCSDSRYSTTLGTSV